MGGAGDPPAPSGDPPTGTSASNAAKMPRPLLQLPLLFRPATDGTGESPVLPANPFFKHALSMGGHTPRIGILTFALILVSREGLRIENLKLKLSHLRIPTRGCLRQFGFWELFRHWGFRHSSFTSQRFHGIDPGAAHGRNQNGDQADGSEQH